MTIAVKIGVVQFRTKSIAAEFCRGILSRYKVGETVGDDDARFLSDLIRRHPKFGVKIGCGIDRFEAGNGKFGSKCFHVVRIDGSTEEFSYKQCLASY